MVLLIKIFPSVGDKFPESIFKNVDFPAPFTPSNPVITPEFIVDSEPLFGEGLGLDSIDALELGVALKKKFGVKFTAESEESKKHFASVDALAEYIIAQRAEK